MEIIYDEMIQPQKRVLIRKLLDACLGRVIELKHDLVNIDMMEFSYNDTIMEQLKLTTVDIQLRVPKYLQRERGNEIKERNKFIENLLIKLGWLEEEVFKEHFTELEAIQMIQIHERARQGRLRYEHQLANIINKIIYKIISRAQLMKEIRVLKEKGKPDGVKEKTDGLVAAMKIQKVWRGFATRRKTRRRKLEEMFLIGMISRPTQNNLEAYENQEKVAYFKIKLLDYLLLHQIFSCFKIHLLFAVINRFIKPASIDNRRPKCRRSS